MNRNQLSLQRQLTFPNTIDKSTFEGISDSDLWKMFKKGDDGAFVFIYRTYVDALYNIGIQYSANDALVKDCLQDFFVDLRQKKYNMADTDNIKLYLFKSFRRRIITAKRKENRYVFQDFSQDSFPIELAIDQKIINAQFDEHQLKLLKTALEQLSSKDRQIVYFYFYEDLSYKEIAELLNYDHISSARREIYKVLKKLRGFMPILLLLASSNT